MPKPLVTVIIPCYNAEKYVEHSIRSIIKQTYKNIEILVTDDCSTDGTLGKLKELSKIDDRICIKENKSNKRIVHTLNELVKDAKGKYIARMDADDISLPERIEKQVKFMEDHADCAICGTNARYMDVEGKLYARTYLPVTYKDNDFFLRFYCTLFHPTIIARTEILKKNLYQEEFLFAEDYELWCRLVFSQKLKIANIEEVLFYYRVHPGQTSSDNHSRQWRISAEALISNNAIPEKYISIHKEVFFLRDMEYGYEAGEYINKVCHELDKYQTVFAIPVEEKIFFYLRKHKRYKDILKLLITKRGIYTVITNRRQKLWKKRMYK